MPRRPASITQADIARALRAVKAAGVDARVEIKPDGTIQIIPAHDRQPSRPAKVEPGQEVVLW